MVHGTVGAGGWCRSETELARLVSESVLSLFRTVPGSPLMEQRVWPELSVIVCLF